MKPGTTDIFLFKPYGWGEGGGTKRKWMGKQNFMGGNGWVE
jgi:hypothetical protein